jgi:squalene synthase HpnC
VVTLEDAYASCLRAARQHYENFPVASVLVPAPMRPHVAAVYAFARAADDFADEGSLTVERRDALLDGWLARLAGAVHEATQPAPALGEPANSVEIFVALGATIRDRQLPVELFEDLISAFRQDVTVSRYAAWEDLLDYCRRSANPVGRLVLRIAGYHDDRLDAWSDALCTALQLTNFWQDLGIDFARGRIYVPGAVMRAHGAQPTDLATGMTREWRAALAEAAARTTTLFAAGRPVCDAVGGRLRYELRSTWLGGTRILDRLQKSGFDPLTHRPSLGIGDAPWCVWRLLTWQPSPVFTVATSSARGHV